MKIRDRIKELRRVKASELAPNPKNWRTHPQEQQDALRGVLAEIGYADALIAAEQLSRVCYGMEISPAYVGVILQRAKDCGMEPRLTGAKKPRAKKQSAK